jgi:PTH1 family peptidyl-tRNA hydrolase
VKQVSTSSANPSSEERGLWLIVGLGNPGSQYDRTRHNIGFILVDELARSEGIECKKLEKSAAVGRGEIEGQSVLLVKPVTFMNNSGESVGALARFYKVPPSRILVISDDLDQPTAAVKLKPKGGHGGHNGLRSIIERLGGSQDFPRLKIGIGRPLSPDLPVASYVLQDFTKKEKELIDVSVQEGITMVRKVLRVGLELAISGQGAKEVVK